MMRCEGASWAHICSPGGSCHSEPCRWVSSPIVWEHRRRWPWGPSPRRCWLPCWDSFRLPCARLESPSRRLLLLRHELEDDAFQLLLGMASQLMTGGCHTLQGGRKIDHGREARTKPVAQGPAIPGSQSPPDLARGGWVTAGGRRVRQDQRSQLAPGDGEPRHLVDGGPLSPDGGDVSIPATNHLDRRLGVETAASSLGSDRVFVD